MMLVTEAALIDIKVRTQKSTLTEIFLRSIRNEQ